MNFIKRKKLLLLFVLAAFLGSFFAGYFLFIFQNNMDNNTIKKSGFSSLIEQSTTLLDPTPSPLPSPPPSYVIPIGTHVFQTFNNCGPAAFSMALSYYGINVTQQELGQALRPYQNPQGDNDDKSTTLEELAEKSQEYGLIPFHRPGGTTEIMKQFIANNMPVMTRTLLKAGEDIGHYRIVRGYDDTTGKLIQDDSLQNKNLRYSYNDFNLLWKSYNYEYLVLVPKEKEEIAKAILGGNYDPQVAWENALRQAQGKLDESPNDIYSRFNLSVALYHTGDYQRSVEEFEKVRPQLTFRTLWYQIEPVQAYFELGNYDRVFQLTDGILNNYNRAFSELYLIRGEIYKKQGNIELARTEFEKAVFYNVNLKSAQEALNSL
ncbi:MAG: C39 family peptidase [Candidatus Levyibacteriota bacterium]